MIRFWNVEGKKFFDCCYFNTHSIQVFLTIQVELRDCFRGLKILKKKMELYITCRAKIMTLHLCSHPLHNSSTPTLRFSIYSIAVEKMKNSIDFILKWNRARKIIARFLCLYRTIIIVLEMQILFNPIAKTRRKIIWTMSLKTLF